MDLFRSSVNARELVLTIIEVTASILQTVGIKEHDDMAIAIVNR
jgi:hypothetical protein